MQGSCSCWCPKQSCPRCSSIYQPQLAQSRGLLGAPAQTGHSQAKGAVKLGTSAEEGWDFLHKALLPQRPSCPLGGGANGLYHDGIQMSFGHSLQPRFAGTS